MPVLSIATEALQLETIVARVHRDKRRSVCVTDLLTKYRHVASANAVVINTDHTNKYVTVPLEPNPKGLVLNMVN